MSPWSPKTAEEYDAIGRQRHVATLGPTLVEMFGDLSGGAAMDFGCGPGRLTPLLARLGARRVAGIDESRRMIQTARAVVSGEAGISTRSHFAIGDERLLPTQRKFDAILCSLVLMMCGTRERLRRSAAGLIGSLAPHGRMVIVLTHPCFRDARYPAFHYEMPSGYTYWDSGCPYRVRLHPREKHHSATIVDHHWTLTDYMNAIRCGGGVLNDLRELPAEIDPHAADPGPPAYLLLRVGRAGNDLQQGRDPSLPPVPHS